MTSTVSNGRNFTKIDFDKFSFSPLEKNERGGLSGKVLYDGSELILQVPVCRLPYGFSESKLNENGRPAYSVSGSFDKTSPIMTQFYKWCEAFEEKLISHAHANAKAMFGKPQPIDAVRALFNGMIKIPNDEEKAAKYEPTFKATVRAKADAPGFWSKCYDTDKQPMDISSIFKGCKGRMIIRLSSFYVINGKFGVTWDLETLYVTQHSSRADIREDPNMYGEEPSHPADVYNEHVEEAIQRAEAEAISKKREREEPPADAPDESSLKKTVKKTSSKK